MRKSLATAQAERAVCVASALTWEMPSVALMSVGSITHRLRAKRASSQRERRERMSYGQDGPESVVAEVVPILPAESRHQ